MSEEAFAIMANQLNVFMTSIGLENMNGQIIENITIPAGQSIAIYHSLKLIPKYRIILRKTGEGEVIDGDSNWTNTSIFLKNVGASDTIVTVFIIAN